MEINTKAKKSKLTLDDLTKEITNENGRKVRVMDFDKISQQPFFLNLLISERGMVGKTYNVKDFTYKQFEKKQSQTLWLRNTVKDVMKEAKNFLKSDCPPNLKDNLHTQGSIITNTLCLYDERLPTKPYLKFQSINTGEDEKGTRVIYDYIVWDEFNVKSNLVRDMINKFDSLLHSTENIVANYGGEDKSKLFIFANNKSLNHPLLIQLGVKSVKWEITEYWVDDYPLMLVIVPQRDKDYIEKFKRENKKNGRFLLSMVLGTADHSYFNTFLYDDINFVDQMYTRTQELINLKNLHLNLNEVFEPMYTIYHKERFYVLFRIDTDIIESKLNTNFHIVEVKEKDIPRDKYRQTHFYVINHNDLKEGALTPKGVVVKRNFKKLLTNCKISFEDIAVRELFISSIKN